MALGIIALDLTSKFCCQLLPEYSGWQFNISKIKLNKITITLGKSSCMLFFGSAH